ncbi:hypothetical protein FRB94_001320 [Tulasnella sp. JGI-2019a]|nr:hypothetical protein FRB94_001320 [Tulasnella sp. JGI-2019a]
MPPRKTAKATSATKKVSTTTPQPSLSDVKLALPAFLQILNKSGGMSMTDAMSVTKKLYPTCNTSAQLADLTAIKLIQLKVDDQEQRKQVLGAIRKAGYVKPAIKPISALKDGDEGGEASSSEGFPEAGPSEPREGQSNPIRKRKLASQDNGDDFITREQAEGLDFMEELNEENLRNKSTHVNRAPVMTAWATVVAECLGFKREEALSIGAFQVTPSTPGSTSLHFWLLNRQPGRCGLRTASVYTELNATSKGISIGVFDESKNRDHVAGSTQPFVELMGRKPVLETETGEWRGIVKGCPVDPKSPFGYIQRSFRQTLPWVMGSMRLLAKSFQEATELNKRGYGLYCDFRPENPGWGKKAEMRMENILKLRSGNTTQTPAPPSPPTDGVVQRLDDPSGIVTDGEHHNVQDDGRSGVDGERPAKRSKG